MVKHQQKKITEKKISVIFIKIFPSWTNFSNHYNFKFGIVGKPRPSGIFKRKIFLKQRRIKKKIKISNFLSKKAKMMRIILIRRYEHLKLYVIICIFRVLIIFYIYQTMYSFLINSSLCPPNFANVSSITVKIKQFQVYSLMRILIVNV